ncbi:holin [Catellatospora sp. KI3]|uniref:holin n=1 Tax=Catellatospora sp. KI3 TaxID=3041620 RepID=UPI002482E61A|nr:holin [Catellatospora sp. KI3]MDI1465534.1 holin [Catellatospora sp. KI3]
MYLLNKQFWIGTMERAIKTFVQALIAAFGVGSFSGAVGVDVTAIEWRGALSLAVSAALLSVLMSIGSGPIGAANSPSLVGAAAPLLGASPAAVAVATATATAEPAAPAPTPAPAAAPDDAPAPARK